VPINTCKRCGKEFLAVTRRRTHCAGSCFRAKEREYSRTHAAKFTPERRRAYILVQGAISRGDLIRQPCEVCGRRQYIHAHHDDYAQPLAVRWLCNRHHKQHHDKFGPGLNAFRKEA